MTAPMKTRGAVLTSSGSGDAGRIPLLGPDGKLDPSFFQAFGAAQSGSAVASPIDVRTALDVVTFTTAFATTPFIIIMPTISDATLSNGFLAVWSVPIHDTAGFTVKFDLNESSGSFSIVNITYKWLALEL